MPEFDKPDFLQLLQIISDSFKSRLHDSHLSVNPAFGKGYVWAQKLPAGITVLVADTTMNQDFSFKRLAGEDHFYCLQFVEQSLEPGAKLRSDDIQSYVRLSHTLNDETFDFPSNNVRARTVAFFFNNAHLSHLIGKQAMDELLHQYFPILIKNKNLQPIATEYRVMLDELLTEKIQHPLRINYIQNRVLLLLESFIVKLQRRNEPAVKKTRRSDDETMRLMKVEALLVRNFETAPPTIDELSRISAMSPTKLKNDFKSLYGLPIYEYYQKNRMLKAKSLLLLGKYSIKEVGILVGYSNLSHFANTFKKEFGHLPSEMAVKDGVLVYNT
jgi:AraC-like DNA-binding protein